MMNPLYSSWNNALDYSRYPRGNTAPTVLPQMHYRYRGSTVHSIPSPRYYREILPIPTVMTAVTAVLPHSPLPCHSLVHSQQLRTCMWLHSGQNSHLCKRELNKIFSTQHSCTFITYCGYKPTDITDMLQKYKNLLKFHYTHTMKTTIKSTKPYPFSI